MAVKLLPFLPAIRDFDVRRSTGCVLFTLIPVVLLSPLCAQTRPGEPMGPSPRQAAELPSEGLTVARVLSASGDGCALEVRYVHERSEEAPFTREVVEETEVVEKVPDGNGGFRTVVRRVPVVRQVTGFVTRRVREPRMLQLEVGFGDCTFCDPLGTPIRPATLEGAVDRPRPAVLLTSQQTLETFYRQLLAPGTLVVVLHGAPEWFHRGMQDECLEEYETAVGRYSQAILQNPDFADAYDHRGACHARLNNPVAAIADYTEFIRIRPDDPHGYFMRGQSHVEAQHVDAEHMEFAIADYTEFIRRFPDSRDGYLRRGEVYREIGELDLAIRDLTQFIRLAPEMPLGYQVRADCYRRAGDLKAAENDERRYTELTAGGPVGQQPPDGPRPDDGGRPMTITAPPAESGFDAFYSRYISVDGFPVISSAKVHDAALREAAWIIRRMLATRPDIRDALIESGTRFTVMAVDEMTTMVPEHSDLTPSRFWDRRARGLGATEQRPCVSCGEENLLRYPGDPYDAESILVHEFAHAIHDMGLRRIDADFDPRLAAIYEEAMAEGLWDGKYAATNRHEYWAEGVQSYFDTNRPPDHDHNHVDTRDELREYDPRLFELIDVTFRQNEWRYTRPDERDDAERRHLVGYDPGSAPTFRWPEGLEEWYREYEARQAGGE